MPRDQLGGLSFPSPIWWVFPLLWQELTPDYSMESHQRDHENYVACSRSHRRRAKALLDFERHDDDELGFRKNDIITVREAGRVELGCWEQVPEGTARLFSLSQALSLLSVSIHLAADETGWCARHWAQATRALPPAFSLQIISQKDEHCWVGELNGLRGEAGHSLLHPSWPPPLTRNWAEPVLSPLAGHLTGPCLSHRLVSSQVCGSPG